MEKNKQSRIAGMGDRITSTISVTLVLFILGLVAGINITFNSLDRQLKEKMGFTVILNDSVSTPAISRLQSLCSKAPYISQFKYLSQEDVLAEEAGADGQALVEMLGVNPYSPVFDIKVKPMWANADSINRIVAGWSALPEVEEVSVNTDMIDNLNRNARMVNTILLVIAATLLLISFVLINNTIRLTVYSRRFTIHTMQLVGATDAFIRRPFILANILQGGVAALIAAGLLAGIVAWGHDWDPLIARLLPWDAVGFILGCIFVVGIAICSLAAILATNRYLHTDYDQMFN